MGEEPEMDLKQFVEKYGEDVCNAILKLADGEECSNELERLVVIEMEDREVGRFVDAYGEEFFDDLYEFMKRKASMEANRTPYKKGDFIGQKYEVHDVLGIGGFGIVYLVYSHETESVYALKTFRDEYLEDSQTRDRFRKEAQVWIDLERHPYLVRASFVDEISGRLFIATEYIAPDEEGLNSLDAFLRRRPPDIAQSLKWGIQFCHGMEYAYSKGIRAHRDIKPANILIGQDRSVKISDFGLAGVIGQARISGVKLDIQNNKVGFSCQTMEGSGFGTPTHMPPEQFTNAAACDERSDIYSFGIVLYQMATGGNLPFLANLPRNEEEHKQFWQDMHRLHSQAPVPRLDSPLYPIIQRCLEKDPNRRYRSFKDLRADMEPILKRLTGEVVKLPEQKELDAWELGNKGTALASLNELREAIACFDSALRINPEIAGIWNNKGAALNRRGRYQEAIACLNRSLVIDPTSAHAWLNRGNALHCLDSLQDAIDCYNRVLKIDYLNVDAWNNKGNVLNDLGDFEEAIVCFDNAIEIDQMCAEAWLNKGNALNSLGEHQEALSSFNKALKIHPMYAEAWYNKGNTLDDLGKIQEAMSCFDRALKINPDYPDAWNNKGVILEKLGNFQEAIACYDRQLEINPQDIDAWVSKGLALVKLGKDRDAIACYDRTLEINPSDAEVWNNKGLALVKLDNHRDAIACFDKALGVNPTDARAWYNKWLSLSKIDQSQAAMEALENFFRFAPPEYAGLISDIKKTMIEKLEERNKGKLSASQANRKKGFWRKMFNLTEWHK